MHFTLHDKFYKCVVLCYNVDLTSNVPKSILMVKRSLLLIQISTWETLYQQTLQTETLQKTFVIYINEAIGFLVTLEYVIAAL